LRIEMERLAVILDHHDAMLASVIHPVLSKEGKATTAGLLPFLVRSTTDTMAVEALLRPRTRISPIDGPSSPKSRDSRISLDGREGENGGPQGADIWSQRETSLNELENGQEKHGDTFGNALGDNVMSENLAARKRTLDDVGDSSSEDVGPVPEKIELREWKRMRPEEATTSMEATSAGNGNENVGIDDSILDKLADTPPIIGRQAKAEDAVSWSTPRTLTGKASENRESDSSDSEIPLIDTGLDTEDEEEELE
jgi:hypothetical protein